MNYETTAMFQGVANGAYTKQEIKEGLIALGVYSKDIDKVVVETFMVHPDDGLSYEITAAWVHFKKPVSMFFIATKWAAAFM